jgi:phosphatidylserine/phosphatidylglycerophosphate/cardiolipin synthase-like enzyme
MLLVGCTEVLELLEDPTGNTVYVPPKQDGFIDVSFCPSSNCSNSMLKVLESASESIHCALFDLRLDEIINVLEEKSKKIDVKVVIDNENEEHTSGKIYRYDTTSQYSHNKFCIIDGSIVTTGSFNPTERGNYKNNNNFLIIDSTFIAQNYEDEFIELWSGEFGKGGNQVEYPQIYLDGISIETYFCPEDNCDLHLIDELRKATSSIYFMTFSFTHEEVADEILYSKADIKGVFEKMQAGSKYSQFNRMKEFGLNVKKDNNSANMHHKVFIIDEKIVVTGSTNPSKSGFYKNDENMVIIEDESIASMFIEEFERVWET